MFEIESNIAEVIADLKRAEAEILAGHHAIVMKPAIYIPDLKAAAHKVLEAMATPTERPLVPGIVDTIIGYASSDYMAFEMVARDESEGMSDFQKGDIGFQRLEPLASDIEEWVRDFKEKTSADRSKYPTDEKLARHIMGVISNNRAPWFTSENPKGLLAFLQENNPEGLSKALGLTSLNSARLSEMLRAVLQYWEDIMGVMLVQVEMQNITQSLGS